MDEQLHRMADDGIGDHLCADDVGLKENGVVVDGAGNMRFRGEMDDDVALGYQLVDNGRLGDVAVEELETRVAFQTVIKVVQVAGIGQRIEQDDFVARIFFINVVDEITADKTGSARDQQCFG